MSQWRVFWSEEVKIENGGRYPLLLNRFHDHLEDILIKGIVSVTDRLRYISYCCWSIGDIQENMDVKSSAEFIEAFRRREGALAIGVYLLNPQTILGNYTTYGRDAMRGKIENIDEEYETSFKVLPSNELGAYGQYYKGTIQSWGLTCVKDGIIYLTELGLVLYRIMDNIYSDSEYYKNYKGKNKVPGRVLYKWGEINQYDNITDPIHSDERSFYQNIIFHLMYLNKESARRDTFIMYLNCIDILKKKNANFNEDNLNDIIYYHEYTDKNNNILNVRLMDKLNNTIFLWSIYEMHAYFRWWMLEYFREFLNLLKRSHDGLSIQEVLNNIIVQEFNDTIFNYTNKKIDYYNMNYCEFFNIIKSNYKDNLLWESKITRDSRNGYINGFSQVSSALMFVISMINIRYDMIKDDLIYKKIEVDLCNDFSFRDIFINSDLLKEKCIKEVLRIILYNFVIRQHDNALYEKKDLRRCWFTLSKDKYQYQSDSSSIWRPAKHNIICNFLYDMGLIIPSEDSYILTNEGNEFFKRIRKEYYEK